jgi:hypothetical protein
MNILVAIQNTIARFQGVAIEQASHNGSLWTIRIAKGDMWMEFEIDEQIRTACVLERKNFGLKSMSRFMNTFLEEIDLLEEDEDPIPPARD